MKILSRLKTISRYDEFDGVKEYCGFAFNSKKYPFLLKALEEKGFGDELEQEKHGNCDYFVDDSYCDYSGSYENNYSDGEPNHLEVDIEEIYIGKTPLSKILSPSDFKKVISDVECDEFEYDGDCYVGLLTLE